MSKGVNAAPHTFLQKGNNMWRQTAEHPSPIRDTHNVHGSGCGRRKRKDAKGDVCVERTAPTTAFCKLYWLKAQQKETNAWRRYQSLHYKERSQCQWKMCPGIVISRAKGVKRPRPRSTHMYCEECIIHKGHRVMVCNNAYAKGKNTLCHVKYHNHFHSVTAEEPKKEEENNSMSD